MKEDKRQKKKKERGRKKKERKKERKKTVRLLPLPVFPPTSLQDFPGGI